MLNKVTFKTVVSLLSFKFLFQDSFHFFILLSFPSYVISLWAQFCQGIIVLFFSSTSLYFSSFSSHLSCLSVAYQSVNQTVLLLSHHFCLRSFLRSCTTLVLVLSVRTHTLCFVSTLYLCSLLTLLSPSLFTSPLTFCSRTALTLPANGHGQRVREFVCQKICGG